jgi:hypothetical protein
MSLAPIHFGLTTLWPPFGEPATFEHADHDANLRAPNLLDLLDGAPIPIDIELLRTGHPKPLKLSACLA